MPRANTRNTGALGLGLRLALSAWIVYHLTAVVLVPNSRNHIGQLVTPIMGPYVDFFEFTNAWSFFAPEPGPPPVYIEYELVDARGESIRRGKWPDMPNPFFLRERQNRRIAAAEFMMSSEVRAEKMMHGYLCRNFAEASSVRIWRVVHTIPTWQEVAEGKRRIGDEVRLERQLVTHSFCEGKDRT